MISRSNVLFDGSESTGNWFGINCRNHQDLTGLRLSWTVNEMLLPMTTPIPFYYQLRYQLVCINTYPFSFIYNAQKYDAYWVASQIGDTCQIPNEIKLYRKIRALVPIVAEARVMRVSHQVTPINWWKFDTKSRKIYKNLFVRFLT